MPRKTQTDPRLLEVYRTIGDNITRERGEKKMTQNMLAEASGVSRSTIDSAENGLGCSLEKLIKLADALGISPADLFITGKERKRVTYQHVKLMDLLAKGFFNQK